MISFRNFVVVGLTGLAVVACGSDDPPAGAGGGGGAGGSLSPSDCSGVGARVKSVGDALGCKDTSADFVTLCQGLYSANKCTAQWASFVNCFSAKTSADFQCDVNNEL